MPYDNQTSLHDFLYYHAERAADPIIVDTEEKVAFDFDSGRMFSLHEVQDIVNNQDNRYLALWSYKKEQPAGAENTDEPMDG